MLTQNHRSAKSPQSQRKQNIFLWLCVASVVVVLFALPAHASTPTDSVPTIPTLPPPPATPIAPYIEAGPVEIVDTNGVGVANSTFYVYCDTNDYEMYISIDVHFVGGGVELRTEQYCGTKIYIEGYVELAEIVAVMAEPPSVVYRVWLPVVER